MPASSDCLVVGADLGILPQDRSHGLEHGGRRYSEAGLSITTTSSGLLDDARTRPQVLSSVVMRTPLTVTRSTVFEPAIGSRASLMARNRGDGLHDPVRHVVGTMWGHGRRAPGLRQRPVEESGSRR